VCLGSLSQSIHRMASMEEIAHEVERPVRDVERMLGLNERSASINVHQVGEDERSLLDAIPDENGVDPSLCVQEADLKRGLTGWLTRLSAKHREVVERRFGLNGHERSTLEQVGRDIGLTRERVRQIQVEALRHLRHIVESEGLNRETLFC